MSFPIYLDIETIPGQDPAIRQAIANEIAEEKAKITAPSNYKDPDKIAQYVAARQEELDKVADDRWRQTALSGARGEIICASLAVGDDPVKNIYRKLGEPESQLLPVLFETINEAIIAHNQMMPIYVGHNIIGFDLRFIYQRAVIMGIKPNVPLPVDERGNSIRVYDTMLAWAGWGNRVSMDNLCAALGIQGKGNDLDGGEYIDGSMVWDFVQRGEEEKVARYCGGDVERTREMYKRLTFEYDPLSSVVFGADK